MPTFECPHDALHRAWDNSLSPALTIDTGDIVTFATVDASDGATAPPPWARQRPAGDARGRRRPDGGRGHPMCGPIVIQGARPGDTLVVEVLAIAPYEWGWTAFRAGGGLLGAEVAERGFTYWDLRGAGGDGNDGGDRRAVPWSSDASRPPMPARVPMQPFCGVMGVAPAEVGEHSTTPPRAVGGNLDVRGLAPGSTLYLPVAVDGALFSVGDVHAAQGDGEVCGTGIECGGDVTLRFDIQRGRRLAAPEYRTPAQPAPGPRYATTGVAPDLMAASQEAVRAMIAYLQAEHGLSAADAYILCSVAVDLSISEVVDTPNWVVSALLPLGVVDSR